jgi:L-alanine-DL-glutamate epimerase-like enolase superfamily enzyme
MKSCLEAWRMGSSRRVTLLPTDLAFNPEMRDLEEHRLSIRSVRTFLVDATPATKDFIFCCLEAECGTVGWGEAYAIPRRARGIVEFVKSLGAMLKSIGHTSPQAFLTCPNAGAIAAVQDHGVRR